LKPARVSFEQAAATPVAGLTALQALRDKGGLAAGQRVLVNGASGGVGTFTVQIAKALGANVTAVCSTRNVELVRSLGADHVLDYTRDDFTRAGTRYDLVIDNIGNHSLPACCRAVAPGGTLVLVGARTDRLILALLRIAQAPLVSRLWGRRIVFFISQVKTEDLDALRELLEAGKVTPAVDRTYPLAEAAAAFRYQKAGHARAKVVIRV
ncbi:MAG TPA: NAD(P)-dependent alcohol dehydrogenase, partial [Deinococcales bacterium]|nr:NAD(P)-dependent alcohol dehydrogenase [Deinococcales bacterium]